MNIVANLGARGEVDTGRLGAAEGQLAAAASELAAAREAASLATRHAAEYKAIADAAEAQLRELSVRGKEAMDAAHEAREKANAEMANAKASYFSSDTDNTAFDN